MASRKRIDTKYIKRLQEGNLDEFDYIFDFYKNQIYSFSFSFVYNQSDADDIVQETFIHALKNIHTLKKLNSFHSWLFKICYHITMKHFRVAKKEILLDTDLDIIKLKATEESEVIFDNNEILHSVEKEMNQLPSNFKSVAQLRYLDDLSVKEISNILEIPEGTVKSRLKTSRELLQEGLKKRGVKPSLYFGFSFLPFMYQMYQQLIAQNKVVITASETLQQHATASSVVGGVAVGGVATLGTVGFSISVIKVIAFASVLSVGFGGAYFYNETQDVPIKQIIYYDQPTRNSVEVKAEISKGVVEGDIEVRREGVVIPFSLSRQSLHFDAQENGEYQLRVKGKAERILIQYIDKMAPVLNDIQRQDGKLRFSVVDKGSGVDFKRSYLEHQGNKYRIDKDGTVDEVVDEDAILYLYDKVDNYSKYAIEKKDVEK